MTGPCEREALSIAKKRANANSNEPFTQMDRFPQFFPQLVPHLYAVNPNGMKVGAAKILPIGQGDRELELLKVIRSSRYRGPIGNLNHIETQDAEVGLRSNIEGLKSLLRQMGDTGALATY